MNTLHLCEVKKNQEIKALHFHQDLDCFWTASVTETTCVSGPYCSAKFEYKMKPGQPIGTVCPCRPLRAERAAAPCWFCRTQTHFVQTKCIRTGDSNCACNATVHSSGTNGTGESRRRYVSAAARIRLSSTWCFSAQLLFSGYAAEELKVLFDSA